MEGESFASYSDRLAAESGSPLSVMLSATGVLDISDASSLRPYGLTLSPERLRAFAFSAWLAPERVAQMLLGSYATVAFKQSLQGEWAYLSGSHVCPACLAESDAWQLAWRLPWSFACLRHGCLLVDTCRACGGRTGPGRSDRRSAPSYLSRVPEPGHCPNPLPAGLALSGRAARPCGQRLSELVAVDLASGPGLLEAQERLARALGGSPFIVGGASLSSVDFLAAARSLCALILYAAEPEDLAVLPGPVVAAFEDWTLKRAANDEGRARIGGGGHDRRGGPRTRCYGRVPVHAALMAAIAPFAVRALSAPSLDGLADAVEPLVRRAEERNPRHARRLPIDFAFSPELRAAFEAKLRRPATFSGRVAGYRQSSPARAYSFTAAHVPQLIWEEVYTPFFDGLIPGSRPESVRRYCSMSLIKLVHGCSWDSAAKSLALPASQSAVLAGALFGRLSRAGNFELFVARLHDTAAWLEALPTRVDFAARRQALAGFSDLDEGDWRELCARSGVHPGKLGARRRFAAAWLWCELTGGDSRLAPALAVGNVQAGRDCYRRFLARDLARVRTELTLYSVDLLIASGLPAFSQLEPTSRP